MCVQEEERLKHENLEIYNLVTHAKGNNKKKRGIHKKEHKLPIKKDGHMLKFFFFKKKGHKKSDCTNYAGWLKKKGILTSLVCHESLYVDVPINSW